MTSTNDCKRIFHEASTWVGFSLCRPKFLQLFDMSVSVPMMIIDYTAGRTPLLAGGSRIGIPTLTIPHVEIP